jgi:hypothetical protein
MLNLCFRSARRLLSPTRLAALSLILLALGGCRTYENYSPLRSQGGLLPADQFAAYGAEQAQLIAIGRALAKWYSGPNPADLGIGAEQAARWARTLPHVRSVVADTLGHRLTVSFASGWRAAALPIDDGKAPEATYGFTAPAGQ